MRSTANITWPWITVNYTADQFRGVLTSLDVDSNFTIEVYAFNRIGESNGTSDLIQPAKIGIYFQNLVRFLYVRDYF